MWQEWKKCFICSQQVVLMKDYLAILVFEEAMIVVFIFLDQSESSISFGQSDFKVFTNQLCQPIRKGLELFLPGWGSWKWEWRARLWPKDGNHEQSWKTLVEETQEGDFCSLHWHFFCNSWSTFEFFLKLTTLSTPKVCKNLILESNESFYTSTNKTILVFRLFCQPS